MTLKGKTVLITGAGVRLGRAMALAVAREGGEVILHYNRSHKQAEQTLKDIESIGSSAHLLKSDLGDSESAQQLVTKAHKISPLYALVNSASIFEPLEFLTTSLEAWEQHIRVNLTAPFLLSKSFAMSIGTDEPGRIINILDWRALRPGSDHFPYTISKSGLAALTQSLAVSLAPNIIVNGLAFGAILPPSDGGSAENILDNVPAERWADIVEVEQSLLFLLQGPAYITGEIIHLDGGRHLI